MKIALIFNQVESNNVYCQLLNSDQDVLSFFYRTLNPGKHRKVQEGEQEVSHCQQTLTQPVTNPKLNSQPSSLFLILCTLSFRGIAECIKKN